MNTANITGRPAGIYGVGPTAARAERPDNTATVSAFVCGVRDWFLAATDAAGTFGGTYGIDAAARYVVGGYADSVVIRAEANTGQAMGAAVAFAEANPPRHYAYGRSYGLGWWFDPATGRVWLDAVRGFDDYADACDAAIRNGEKAIYRASDGQAIDVATSVNITDVRRIDAADDARLLRKNR